MTTPHKIVFLIDVDNTLLNNDCVFLGVGAVQEETRHAR
jgi:hypothetical protein